MLNEGSKAQSELSAVIQEKSRVEEHIALLQQRILADDKWLKAHTPTTPRYQKALEEWQALQAYVAELDAQVTSLDEALQDLRLEQERQQNPD
jgi:hypothetical protein